MIMEVKIQKLRLKGTVDTCPVCDYTDGFHVSFKEEGKTKIILICPQCHSRFDPDWKHK
jgi:ssDNA-binding Zn-finger/Zn-ribbon topoisomerase 1